MASLTDTAELVEDLQARIENLETKIAFQDDTIESLNDSIAHVHHPEDMASFIIIAYHRNLKREPLNIKQLVDFFAEKKAKEKAEQQAKGKVIFEETRKRDIKN